MRSYSIIFVYGFLSIEEPQTTGSVREFQEESLLDDIISRLLDARNGRPGKQVQLTENDIRQLCMTAREIFQNQPNLLELEAPIKICGENTFVSYTRVSCGICTLHGDVNLFFPQATAPFSKHFFS